MKRRDPVLRCSHVICRVEDIHALVRDYEDLGFTMEWGATPDRAHNAFVRFADGPFLEFYELAPGARMLRWPLGLAYGFTAGDRIARWARPGEGCRDVAVETDATSLAATRAALRAAGVATSRVIKGSRTRPDGQLVRYEFLAIRPVGLPFVVSAYDPPQRPQRIVHPNGARGIRRVRRDVAAADRPALERLVGGDPHLELVSAATTIVRGVTLDGLIEDLDTARLHGAVLIPTTPRTQEDIS
jgi:Glyoxalase-like domain